jgi:hypothetical protein
VDTTSIGNRRARIGVELHLVCLIFLIKDKSREAVGCGANLITNGNLESYTIKISTQ